MILQYAVMSLNDVYVRALGGVVGSLVSMNNIIITIIILT